MSPTLSALRVYATANTAPRDAVACRPTHPLDFAPTALQPLIRSNGVTDRRRKEGEDGALVWSLPRNDVS